MMLASGMDDEAVHAGLVAAGEPLAAAVSALDTDALGARIASSAIRAAERMHLEDELDRIHHYWVYRLLPRR